MADYRHAARNGSFKEISWQQTVCTKALQKKKKKKKKRQAPYNAQS
jgi:hypothetical protein